MVPAKTLSPGPFSTGRLSPVIGAWSMLDWPLITSPSRPMRSPGRTRTKAPSTTCLTSTSRHWPSACRTVAISGVSCINPPMALRARSSERASINSATVNRNMTMAASGHCPISTAPVTAMLISALMLRLPFFRAIQPFL
ncbi:hypothetical protein D3C72_1319430 [compost metagenome]